MTICAEPAAMPRTGKAADGTPQGLDVAVAQRVARVLGRAVEFHWCASADCSWHCLPEGRCDVVVGQPHGSGPAHDVAWSVPYAGGQFGLVVRRAGKDLHSLDDLRGKRVGIVTGSVPLSEKDHSVVRFKTREEVLNGFQTAALDAAFLDADFAAWYLHDHPQLSLRLVPEYVPREHWNMAMAVRARSSDLLVDINRALAQLDASGELEAIYAEHGVTRRRPFTDLARRQAATNTWERIQKRGEMVVSLDPANLPYSSAKTDRPGFDVELAQLLAERLHVKLRIDWLDIQRETAMGRLLEHECDLVMGAAVDPNAMEDDDELAGKVVYSRPYYGTGYLLVRRQGEPAIHSLKELKGERSQTLGTEAGSIADYRLRQQGYLRRLFRNQLATLKALHDREIDYAYVWANVGWLIHASPDMKLELVPGYQPEDHWNIAIAMRQGDGPLKERVDLVLEALVNDGSVERLLSRYHVPYFGPFPDRADQPAGRAQVPIVHEVANRGPEPQMARIQTSKHPYGGLARIRTAGELVVGLDQNNLPFSSAHPQPTGLDHEIARLLADQLGVSLRVYWAYSSHDSYPSKLASKKLCDVILGVTPDDRFGQRVLYSRPYHVAGYEWVVRPGGKAPADGEPVAVEDGVAVRGLGSHQIQRDPSLEAVLEEVATGHVAAGYVISTRGRWLAQERWPGKLAFLPGEGEVDRVPICAAVRKNEPDLKAAIDRAWEELDRSGRLADVFARWHIAHQPAGLAAPRREPSR